MNFFIIIYDLSCMVPEFVYVARSDDNIFSKFYVMSCTGLDFLLHIQRESMSHRA